MSMPWGPAIDAELGYRQQRVQSDFRRGRGRRAARSTPRSSRRTPVARAEPAALVLRAPRAA